MIRRKLQTDKNGKLTLEQANNSSTFVIIRDVKDKDKNKKYIFLKGRMFHEILGQMEPWNVFKTLCFVPLPDLETASYCCVERLFLAAKNKVLNSKVANLV